MVGASGILELTPEDQVVTVSTEIEVDELRGALREVGQDIPLGRSPGWTGRRLSDLLAWNLPHTCEGGFGTWRDWVLGAKMRTASGLVGRSGARVVKSVAGFDVHRLFIGARGALGEILEVHLKTVPASAVREDLLEEGKFPAEEVGTVLRVPRRDLDKVTDQLRFHLVDYDTATIWTEAEVDIPWAKVWWSNGPFVVDPTTARHMRRAKAIFDPEGVLPPLEIVER